MLIPEQVRPKAVTSAYIYFVLTNEAIKIREHVALFVGKAYILPIPVQLVPRREGYRGNDWSGCCCSSTTSTKNLPVVSSLFPNGTARDAVWDR